MKLNNLLLCIVFVLFGGTMFASEIDSSKYSLIEIQTPSEQVYDDGIYRTVYSSFEILDQHGNALLKVGEVFDNPAVVKLNEGKYTIVYADRQGKRSEKEIHVETGNLTAVNLNNCPPK